MVERARLFKGATELSIAEGYYEKSDDRAVNLLKFSIEKNADVTRGCIIDVKKADGSTTVFSAKVFSKKEVHLWDIEAWSNGYELTTIPVEKVYVAGTAIEDIVKDIVDNFTTNLTYASTETSGITLDDDYIAKGFGMDTVTVMMVLLDWQLRIDNNDNVYFEPKGSVDNGIVLTNGSNFQVTEWEEDDTYYFNSVKVKAGFESRNTTETISGTGTTFTLSHKPAGSMKAVVSGSEVSTDDYKVKPEDTQVVFSSSKTDPTFTYDFNIPVVVYNYNDDEINDFGMEVFQEIQAPHINSFPDARRYSQQLLDTHSVNKIKCKGYQPDLRFNVEAGEQVTVIDTIRSKEYPLVIRKVVLDFFQGKTFYELGHRDFVFHKWVEQVQERMKQLEQRIINEDTYTIVKHAKHNMNISLAVTQTFKYSSPVNSFIPGHPTLSCMRSGFDREIDCSGNTHNGQWSGTGVTTGDQYSTSGWRLSSATFNGSNRYMQVAHHADITFSGDMSIFFAIKIASNPGASQYIVNKYGAADGYYVFIDNDGRINFVYRDSGTGAAQTFQATTLSTGQWVKVGIIKNGTLVNITYDGTNVHSSNGSYALIGTPTSVLYVGRNAGGNYLNAEIDEVRLYNNNITDTVLTNLLAKIMESTNLQLYLPMDNPYLGDRTTTPSEVPP